MKRKNNLLLLLILISLAASAQNNIIKMHTGILIPSRFKMQYERKLNEKFSAGVIGSFFMHNYLGYRLEPFSRYYLGKKATTFNGMFFQAKAHYTWVTDKTPEREIIEEYGASLSLGYEKILPSGISIDFFIGSRFSQSMYKAVSESATMFNLFYCLPVDFGLTVGYAF